MMMMMMMMMIITIIIHIIIGLCASIDEGVCVFMNSC